MKLTNQQITFIDSILFLNGFKYDDVKLEVMDHIASEVEVLMDVNKNSFDVNLKTVLHKWSKELKPSTSIFTGFRNSYPQMILEKKVSVVKRQLLMALAISFVVLLSFLTCNRWFEASRITYNFQLGVMILYIVGCLLLVVNYFRINISKVNTSFKNVYKARLIFYLYYIYPICFFNTPTTLNNQILLVLSESLIIFHLLLSLQLVQKHFQFEKKVLNLLT
jgi:hypothetical protein